MAERFEEAFYRVNVSPLGSAALGTSSFPVDRERLAGLLGFDGVIENSFGAVHVAPIDVNSELVGLSGSSSLLIGSFVAYIIAQYHDPRPWIIITDGDGRSSIMPQKRNPTSLVNLRTNVSSLLARSQSYLFAAHNVGPGMMDYKRSEAQDTLDELAVILRDFGELMGRVAMDNSRAVAEVNADYSTTTELANVLPREADVPFRLGHHFASEFVTYGRSRGIGTMEVPYEAVQEIYARAAAENDFVDTTFPLDESSFRRALSPESMIEASLGLGGPQPSEIRRMLEAQRRRLAEDMDWIDRQEAALESASANLQDAFENLKMH